MLENLPRITTVDACNQSKTNCSRSIGFFSKAPSTVGYEQVSGFSKAKEAPEPEIDMKKTNHLLPDGGSSLSEQFASSSGERNARRVWVFAAAAAVVLKGLLMSLPILPSTFGAVLLSTQNLFKDLLQEMLL